MDKKKKLALLTLHLILALYSVCGVFSKMASKSSFLSIDFCLYYCGIILLLGIYAIVWQQVIKELPLTVAFANKAVTVLWGIIWGIMLFNENIALIQFIGASLIITGIILFSIDAGEMEECQS